MSPSVSLESQPVLPVARMVRREDMVEAEAGREIEVTSGENETAG